MRARRLLVLVTVVSACGAGSSGSGNGAGGAATGSAGGQGGSRGGAGGTGSGGTSATGGVLATGGSPAVGGMFATGGALAKGGNTSPVGGNGGGLPAGGAGTTGGAGNSGGAAGGSGAGDAGRDGGLGGAVSDARADAGIDARPDAVADTARETGTDGNLRPDSGALTSDGAPCPFAGNVTYTLAKSANPSSAEQAADGLITAAMDKAVYYYNCYTNISKKLSVSYVADSSVVPTADGNINGSIRFGPSTSYMEHVTAMHEIAHTVGIGTASNWSSMLRMPDGGNTKVWSGSIATAELRGITGVATDVVYGDSQHFWPYGLNYASEWHSEGDGIAHCRMVMALRKDMGMQ